ncbi:DUF6514 family protein [Clostridium akagii]|uniref:DUF6514 family protein n=1 Tax=Clostridium akagii TaxID=91623 RepID=UPI000479C2FA|nr:DUF6514 family protein [Clostridium akagii]
MYIMDTLSKSLKDDDVERRYEYRVIRSSFKSNNYGEEGIQSYGIEVERKDLQGGKVFNLERDIIKNVSPQIHKVQSLAKLLYDNVVSPINCVEVLGEYVDQYISDFSSDKLQEASYKL